MIAPDLAALATPVDKLRLLPGNPRRGDVDAVARSLGRFGQRKPIVASRDGTVVAGNHTLQAAQQLGWSEIAVVWVDDDEATAQAFALADNRTAELGGYDETELLDLIQSVGAVDPALLADTGWLPDAVAALEASLTPTVFPDAFGCDPDDQDVTPPVDPVSKPGDVWALGRHRLAVNDARDVGCYDLLLDGDLADMVWTDPPYGVAYVGKTADALTIQNDALDAEQLAEFLRESLGGSYAASRPGAAWYTASPAGTLFDVFATILGELGLRRHTLTWVKDQFVMGRCDYHYRHEPIFYGWKEGAAHTWNGGRAQDSVLEIPRPKRSADHPTMKPIELVQRCIQNSSDPGDIVLDPFGGSGTTLLAAHIAGRTARLIELDPRYADVICRRYQQATGEKPVLAATGEAHDFTREVDDAEPAGAA